MGAVKNMVYGFTGVSGAQAAERGGELQYQAALRGVEEQRAAREQMQQQLAPFVGAGGAAQSQLLELLGIRDPGQTAAYQQALAFKPQFSDKERAMILQSGETGRGRGSFTDKFGQVPQVKLSKEQEAEQLRYQQAVAERDQIARNQQTVQQYEAFQPSERFGMLTRDVTQGLPSVMPGNIEQDSLFQSLKRQAISGIEGSAAARGKLMSGTTPQAIAEQVQNLALQRAGQIQGMNLAARGQLFGERTSEQARQYQQLFNVLGTGQASAAQQAANIGGTASNISNLLGQAGNAQAAAGIGAAQAYGQGAQNVANTAMLAYALSDRRAKEDITQIGTLDNGLPVYTFKYKGGDTIHMGVMAQDVEKVNPDAVLEIGGIKHVNYGAL
jgi:hypothetical protein